MSLFDDLRKKHKFVSAADLLANSTGLSKQKPRYSAKTLLQQFRDVFNRSVPSTAADLKNVKISPVENKFVNIDAIVVGSDKKHQYKVHITFFKLKKDDIISVHTPIVVKCECDAFHYWVAHPLLAGNSLWGKPKKWNKVPAYDRNPQNIATVCKHLHGLLGSLINSRVMRTI